jgi:LacI family transcriptional regulator
MKSIRVESDSAPSMSDVARLAEVSMATVSNTLNRPDKVSDDTRAKVHRAIDQLGFVRNAAARSIAAGVSSTVGIVLVDLGNSLFVDIARGAERQAQASGMSLLLANSDVSLDKQDAYLHLFDEARVAGIILAPLDDSLAEMEKVRRHGRPVVLVNDTGINTLSCGVVVDEQHGGYLATKHLLDCGRTRIAFVGSPHHFHAIRDRYIGAQNAIKDAANGATLELIETRALNVRDGHDVGLDILEREASSRPDGIFAAADLLAVGVIQALHRREGIEIPRDISVIGYDNNHFASESMVPVSTIAQPAEEMGQAAMKLLLDEARKESGHVHRRITLRPKLIVRQSSCLNESDETG